MMFNSESEKTRKELHLADLKAFQIKKEKIAEDDRENAKNGVIIIPVARNRGRNRPGTLPGGSKVADGDIPVF